MGCYLVTGVAGFIGMSLAKRLLSMGNQVVGIDNLSTGYSDNIPKEVLFFKGGCQDASLYNEIPQVAYEAIFHIAGQSSGEISFDDPVYDLRTNTESTLHLLKFALKINCHRFIYASSMSVYGDFLSGPVTERDAINPKSFYAVGKFASEQYLKLYEQYGIKSTSLRFFNVYGPGQNLANLRQGMVSIYLAQLFSYDKIKVQGDPDRFRDFIYIDDVIAACLLCLSHPEASGKAINIAYGVKTKVTELINKLITISGKQVEVEYSGKTPGDIYGSYANISLAKQILGFNPQYNLDNGLEKMIAWAKSIYRERVAL